MQFDTLVSNILNEQTITSLPILDGTHEEYYTLVVGIDENGNGTAKAGRDTPFTETDFDTYKPYIKYKGDNCNQALHAFAQQLSNARVDKNVQDILDNTIIIDVNVPFAQLKDVKCTWLVMSVDDEIVYLTAIVDTAYYYNKTREETPFVDFDF